MRKCAAFAEMNIILMTITKAPRRIWALERDESWFEEMCETICTALAT